jgi:transposase
MAWRSGQRYAADLRPRVLAAVDGGSTAGAVAVRFGAGLSSIDKALARRRQTGATEARAQRSPQDLKLAAHHATIRARVASCPDVTLDELRAWPTAERGASASLGLMPNTLARLELTRKKDRPCAGAGPLGHHPCPYPLACRTGGATRATADLHRRDRGGHQDGAPRSLPRT